ncbi:hypothetical protein PHYBLDRAFT_167814 [Phycomyces blakesleeanus NRRL 1555(-)]|uniref:Uncharacterized protein n=1 Tax=Phycomyces blakesleeanus (strain ATCC 8743b / DSM 1359 / FGSC 10004 / NBRC 33097 / NRRL 1555) TaxID=763407 RepID=A0A163ALY7_PHYB8|nr:hypothetical protein PHYBLDRAFT_167814 [Phycomyces blakesleeanus NRRL 1555(-)]OAD74401.1 hypothetical protein PHYBLDRAFT_167814 [Phycomyces blakesleeanus NRRL 1555(-)]|eukprot:XP_018292441.1 hypothetical protein PHYBLDRAFT_167814 [Phycomyces blakesleeanus NRRL 1555(-)]
MFLHEFLPESREVGWLSPKKNKKVIELSKKYERYLVYGQVQTNVDSVAHFMIRDSYKSGKIIRVLKSLWTSDSESEFLDTYSISSSHHMLFWDQKLRNLNFANRFCTAIPKKQHKGVQQALALDFSLEKGKTLNEGDIEFACALRHENIFRCLFGAFVIVMFSLLQVY